jgi:hypothetical protein
MIIGIVLGCYAVAWLFTARVLYGRWRAKGVDHYTDYPYGYATERAIDSWNDISRGPVMAGALTLALLWPLVPGALLVIRFMDSAPQLSQAEMRDRLAARDRRIAELERELNLPEAR